jgi:hypothetical protein
MDRVRARVADKRVLALVKAFFLKAGILTEIGTVKESVTGTSLCAALPNSVRLDPSPGGVDGGAGDVGSVR